MIHHFRNLELNKKYIFEELVSVEDSSNQAA